MAFKHRVAVAGIAAGVLGWLSLASPGRAAQPEHATGQLAGQIDLARLVDLAAERLGLNIEYDSSVLKGNVTLRLGAGVSDEELWSLTNRVLASRGFTTLRAGGPESNVISVVKVNEAAALSAIRDPSDPSPSTAPQTGFQTVVVRLEHRPAKDVVEAVGKVTSKPGGTVSALDEGGAGGLLLIADLTPRVEQALTVVRMLDRPNPEAVVEEIALTNVGAIQLASLAEQVAAKRELVGGGKVPGEVIPSASGNSVLLVAPADRLERWRALIASLDRRERVETVTYSPPAAFSAEEVGGLMEQTVKVATDDRWRLVADALTGTLIVTATPTQHAGIRALLDRLAATPAAASRPVRSFVVRNRSVTELADVLNGLVQAGVLGANQSGGLEPIRGVVPPENVVDPVVEPEREPPLRPQPIDPSTLEGEPALAISTDEATSTLIVMGEPHLLDQVAALIERLDVRQAQVMLEVLMVSLTEAQTLNLGVELEALDLGGDTIWRLASLFGLSQRGADGAPAMGSPSGLSAVVLNPGDFSVVIRALKTINDGRSQSMPKVLVGNNEQATLDSVLEQPFTTTVSTSTSPVATTSFGGSSVAGTQLSIKPQIAEGDHLILEYEIALSSFTGAASNENLPPPKQTNKVASVATIPDGHTIVVGGIDLTNNSKAVSQVPLIARIPLLGEAFKNRSRVSNRTRFYVFIRANVLRARGFEDLKYISQAAAEATGVDDGCPELEPRVIR